MSVNDGGKVYPTNVDAGMSLRARLAGQALKGMLSCQDFCNEVYQTVDTKEQGRRLMAIEACQFADALITELEKDR